MWSIRSRSHLGGVAFLLGGLSFFGMACVSCAREKPVGETRDPPRAGPVEVLPSSPVPLPDRSAQSVITPEQRARLEALFPSGVEGWPQQGVPTYYDADHLYEYIDGAAEAFLAYDFQVCATVGYGPKEGGEGRILLDLYDLGNDLNAFGMYRSERFPQGAVAVGTEGCLIQNQLTFWKARYYVKVTSEGAVPPADLRAMARAVASLIPGPARFPELLRTLPEEGRVAGTERYVRRDLWGQSSLGPAVTAKYQQGKATADLFVMAAADPAAARKVYQQFRRAEEEGGADPKSWAGLGDEAFTARDRYLGLVVVARRQNLVAGVVNGQEVAEAVKLLKAVWKREGEGK